MEPGSFPLTVSLLLMVSARQRTLSILLRQLFVNTRTFERCTVELTEDSEFDIVLHTVVLSSVHSSTVGMFHLFY